MRSSDARWHLAVDALARMPELAHRLVEVHQADERGYCRGCMAPGGTLFVRWPCGLHRLASASTAPGRVVPAEPAPELEPGSDAEHQPAFGGGRRSAFGPHRRRPRPDAPPDGVAESGG
jgi:hypothetical protein